MLHRLPEHYGLSTSRWTLEGLLASCSWLRLQTLGGLSALLQRLGFSWKGSRQHIRSPDPEYEAKRTRIAKLVEQVRQSNGKQVLLYLDEVSVYRQPTLAHAWETKGKPQALAERDWSSDTCTRVVATLDHQSGQVVYHRDSRIGVAQLVGFLRKVREAYPNAEQIWLVLDNWPVHFHADVLAALQRQPSPFELRRAKWWSDQPSPKALREWGEWQLPIQLVGLPTYASWLNPIEKLWRWLRQDCLHLHQWAKQLTKLREQLDKFLDQFRTGSAKLLHYVGLAP